MNCASASIEITAYRRGELPEELGREIAEHLRVCPDCAAELAAEAELDSLVAATRVRARDGFARSVVAAISTPALAGEPHLERGLHTGLGAILIPRSRLEDMRRAVRRHSWKVSLSVVAHAAVLLLVATLAHERRASAPERWVAVAVLEAQPLEMITGAGRDLQSEILHTGDLHTLLVGAGGGDGEERGWGGEHDSGGESDTAAAGGSGGELVGRTPTDATDPSDLFTRLDHDAPSRPGQAPELLGARGSDERRNKALARSSMDTAALASVSEAIDRGLAWLAVNQEEDGSWDVAAFGGDETLRAAVTGLATMAFLSEGHSSASDTRYGRSVVAPAIAFLEARMEDGDGGIDATVGKRGLFNHALGSLALAENLALLEARGDSRPGDEQWRAVQSALRFLLEARVRPQVDLARDRFSAGSSPRAAVTVTGGWGYMPGASVSDTNVSGWCAQAFFAYEAALAARGRRSSRSVEEGYRGVRRWLADATDPSTGLVGYDGFRRPGKYGPGTLTAIGLLADILTGGNASSRLADAQTRAISTGTSAELRGLTEDYSSSYFSSFALYARDPGGDGFRRWFGALAPRLVREQIDEGPELAGAWPLDRWASFGGRVYSTAQALLVLQTPYRYQLH